MRLSPRLAAGIASLTGLLLATSACTSHHQPAGPSSASLDALAVRHLQDEATLAGKKSFTATYLAQGGSPERTDTVQVYRTPAAARIDVEESGTTVRIVADKSGTYSCKLAPGAAPLCVTLAGAGQQLSPSLAAQLQLALLFTTAPAQLASGSGYHVQPADTQAPSNAGAGGAGASGATGSLPTATCFAIVHVPTDSDVAPGTYCFSNGLLVSARYRTGSLQLTSIGASPDDSDFSLPASPVPLPSGSAAATPS